MAPMGRNRYQQESGSSTQGAAGPLPTQEGRAAPSAGSGQSPSGQPRPGTGAAPQGQPAGAVAEGGYAGGQRSGAGALDAMIRGMTGAGGKRPGGPPPGASPDEEIDAAVKAIREARDEDAKRRAVDALEKALKELRQQRKGI